jgi:hypothetical protein
MINRAFFLPRNLLQRAPHLGFKADAGAPAMYADSFALEGTGNNLLNRLFSLDGYSCRFGTLHRSYLLAFSLNN